jgi:hypothetical protein
LTSVRLDRCFVVLALAGVSCTQILGIDGRYSLDEGSGGKLVRTDTASPGSGGRTEGAGGLPVNSSGGFIAVVDSGKPSAVPALDAAPDDAAAVCTAGTKRCNVCTAGTNNCEDRCVEPDPSIGCGLLDCTPCAAAPANAFSVCTEQKCEFECVTGDKTADGKGCKVTSTGAGGTEGDDAGSGKEPTYFGPCTQKDKCPPCGVFSGCCNPINHCGCLYVAACI